MTCVTDVFDPSFFTFLFLILTGIMVNRHYEIKKEVKFGA